MDPEMFGVFGDCFLCQFSMSETDLLNFCFGWSLTPCWSKGPPVQVYMRWKTTHLNGALQLSHCKRGHVLSNQYIRHTLGVSKTLWQWVHWEPMHFYQGIPINLHHTLLQFFAGPNKYNVNVTKDFERCSDDVFLSIVHVHLYMGQNGSKWSIKLIKGGLGIHSGKLK